MDLKDLPECYQRAHTAYKHYTFVFVKGVAAKVAGRNGCAWASEKELHPTCEELIAAGQLMHDEMIAAHPDTIVYCKE